MNYTAKDLKEVTRYPRAAKWMLTWNDNGCPPDKNLVVGMQIGKYPWITEAYLQDGTTYCYWQHAAEIPEDWTPYQEPKEIPFFKAEVGKKYRVVGNCGMDFDRIMICIKKNEEGNPLFGDSMDDKNSVGITYIKHIYTC